MPRTPRAKRPPKSRAKAQVKGRGRRGANAKDNADDTPEDAEESSPTEAPPESSLMGPERPKRTLVTAACDPCRHRKKKCDNARPVCRTCENQGMKCVYATEPSESRTSALKRRFGELEEKNKSLQFSYDGLHDLFDAISSRSEADAAAIFQSMRQGVPLNVVLQNLQTANLLMQLQVGPEKHFHYSFPYRTAMPEFLFQGPNPYVQSAMYDAAVMVRSPGYEPASGSRGPGSGAIPPNLHAVKFRPQYLRPYFSATLADRRLSIVEPSKWTSVSTDDNMMRRLLELYLLHEFHWMSCFQKDIFLDDMVSGSTNFCSSLLVNAILAQACCCDRELAGRVEYWNPSSLGYKFFAEAKRLWELEADEDYSITTIQAGLVINIILNTTSMDKLGMSYGAQAVAMAQDLGLFESSVHIMDRRRRNAYDYTAWSIYFWMNFQCFHLLRAPIVPNLPQSSLPDTEKNPDWYGEFHVDYPQQPDVQPMHHPQLFKAKTELIIIVSSILTDLFGDPSTKGTIPQQKLVSSVGSLQVWYRTLPPELQSAQIVFPFQIKMHLFYQNAVMKLCELLTITPAVGPSQDSSIPYKAQGLLRFSLMCFETLMRMYYLHHGFDHADSYLAHCLTVLAYIVINNNKQMLAALGDSPKTSLSSSGQAPSSSSPSTQASSSSSSSSTTMTPKILSDEMLSTLILAAKGLSEQGKNYYLPFTLFHVVSKDMHSADQDAMHGYMTSRSEDWAVSKIRTKHIKAQYPVNIFMVSDNPDSQRLGNLVQEYSKLALDN